MSERGVWRWTFDTSAPIREAWTFPRPFLSEYDVAGLTLAESVQSDVPVPLLELIPPTGDPPTVEASAERSS